jgi:3-hydroxyacyl-CoA dehydrogenase
VDVRERVAIIGSGLIGRAWAVVFAGGGCDVALYDAVAGVAEKASTLVAEGLEEVSSHEKRSGTQRRLPPACVPPRAAPDALDGRDAPSCRRTRRSGSRWKRAIFAELDRLSAPDAILASSTSTIVASAFTESLKGRHRCLVAHPVNPPHLVPLVELVAAPWTTPAIITKAKAIYEAVGQVPIVVKREIEGFILNRLQAVLLSEAFRLVEDDYVTPQDLDKTLRDGLGLRWSFMGPFETIELNAPGASRTIAPAMARSLSRLSAADPTI